MPPQGALNAATRRTECRCQSKFPAADLITRHTKCMKLIISMKLIDCWSECILSSFSSWISAAKVSPNMQQLTFKNIGRYTFVFIPLKYPLMPEEYFKTRVTFNLVDQWHSLLQHIFFNTVHLSMLPWLTMTNHDYTTHLSTINYNASISLLHFSLLTCCFCCCCYSPLLLLILLLLLLKTNYVDFKGRRGTVYQQLHAF